MSLDYPQVGVCAWKEFSQEVAFWVIDPSKGGGLGPPATDWRTLRRILQMVRQRPFSTNPWRQCFARYAMTPHEAYKTIVAHDFKDDVRSTEIMNKAKNRLERWEP